MVERALREVRKEGEGEEGSSKELWGGCGRSYKREVRVSDQGTRGWSVTRGLEEGQ